MVNRVGLFLLAVLLALLAPRTGSAAPIEAGYFATINGIEQRITIRGRDSRNPIPMFFFQGELGITTPTVLAKEYFDAIKAPAKEFAVIPGAGHATVFFADELLQLLNTHVRPRVMETEWVR